MRNNEKEDVVPVIYLLLDVKPNTVSRPEL
jgi:hypothetical protein